MPRAGKVPVKHYIPSGGSTVILNHTYTFDGSNRLSTEKITDDTGDIVIKTYTYY
jgi:hypothetical protein